MENDKLKASESAYESAEPATSTAVGVQPNKGFELKPGSNGRSSGPALPINVDTGTAPKTT